MPKRVLDFDALWASDKIANCACWAQPEYAWFYGLADASGCFELTNMRVIWGRVAAIRKDLTLERLTQVFDEFIANGLLFTWEENGKRYGHWTGSDVPGRLPAPSWRVRLERLAPSIPHDELALYVARYSSRRGPRPAHERTVNEAARETGATAEPQLKLHLEAAQAQDLDLDMGVNLDLDEKKNTEQVCAPNFTNATLNTLTNQKQEAPEQMFAIYQAERGSLPAAQHLTPERRQQCMLRIAAGLSVAEFGLAVRRAAASPFLSGAGERGWRASFDWLLANDTNARKVLDGCYDTAVPGDAYLATAADSASTGGTSRGAFIYTAPQHARRSRSAPAALYAGAGPPVSIGGVHIKPAALARIRARERALNGGRNALTRESSTDVTAGSRADAATSISPTISEVRSEAARSEPSRSAASCASRAQEEASSCG